MMMMRTTFLGSNFDRKVLFSKDDARVFSVAGNEIRVTQTATGKRSHTIVADATTNTAVENNIESSSGCRVTDIALSSSNCVQILTAHVGAGGTGGRISAWDVEDGSEIHTINVDAPVLRIATTEADLKGCYAIVSRTKKKKKTGDDVLYWEMRRVDTDPTAPLRMSSRKRKANRSARNDAKKSAETKKKRANKANAGVDGVCGDLLARGKMRKETNGKSKKQEKAFDTRWPFLVAQGRYVAVVFGKQAEVFDVVSGKVAASYLHTHTITAVAICPTKPMMAFGDVTGKIHLWYGLPRASDDFDETRGEQVSNGGDEEEEEESKRDNTSPVSTITVLHWHAHAVACLAFGEEGNQLFSGGNEAVLVVWQLESQDINFLPRLGGPLTAIRCNRSGTAVSVCCGDNSLRLVDAVSLATRWKIRGLATYASSSAFRRRLRCAAPVVDPVTRTVAVPTCIGGASASLQFWDAQKNKHSANLDVAGRNRVSRKEVILASSASGRKGKTLDKSKRPRSVVEAVAFSLDGKWLVTADATTVGDRSIRQRTIRFWRRGSTQTTSTSLRFSPVVVLSETADARVRCASFGPSSKCVVTTHASILETDKGGRSGGGERKRKKRSVTSKQAVAGSREGVNCYKVWELYRRKETEGPAKWLARQRCGGGKLDSNGAECAVDAWRCRGFGRYRNAKPSAATWSSDGSLLAVAFGTTATLWGGKSTNTLLRAVTHPSSTPIHSLGFLDAVGLSSPPLLVVASTRRLSAYDLLTWRARFERHGDVRIGDVCVGPSHDRFAAVLEDSIVAATTKGKKKKKRGDEDAPTTRVVEFTASATTPTIVGSVECFRSTLAYLTSDEFCSLEPSGSMKMLTAGEAAQRSKANNDATDTKAVDVAEDGGYRVATTRASGTILTLFGSGGRRRNDVDKNGRGTAAFRKSSIAADGTNVLRKNVVGPSHTLPPPRTLLNVLCSAMLPPPPRRTAFVARDGDVGVGSTGNDDGNIDDSTDEDSMSVSTDFDLDSIANESSLSSATRDSRRESFESFDGTGRTSSSDEEGDDDDDDDDFLFSTALGDSFVNIGGSTHDMENLIEEHAVAAAVEKDDGCGMSVEDLKRVIFSPGRIAVSDRPKKKPKTKGGERKKNSEEEPVASFSAQTPKKQIKRSRARSQVRTAPQRRRTRSGSTEIASKAPRVAPATERKRRTRRTSSIEESKPTAGGSGGIARRTRSRRR
eukprot:g1534.t1